MSSTNMSLPIPTVGVTIGPDWAQDLDDSLNLIDAHDHTIGKGVPITTDALSINADLTFTGFNATNLRSTRFVNLTAQINNANDLNAIYVYNGNLYFRNQSTNQVQITNGSGVAGTTGSITNLTPPASANFISPSVIFQSNVNVAANVDCRNIILRNSTAGSGALIVSPPASLPPSTTITLPNLPALDSVVTIDPSGVMGTAPILPTGTILAFGGINLPNGYLWCDGSAINRITYANLFAVLGTSYGDGDTVTTFNVPDLRAMFLRGTNTFGSGTRADAYKDPNAGTRPSINGGASGDNIGSIQADAFESHTHQLQLYDDSGTNGNGAMDRNTSFPNPLQTTTATGGSETRPNNIYVNYIIKT